MSFCVVTEPCHDCKYTDCVTVCPCDCFYQDAQILYIDPHECIDCGACIPECPVAAIFTDAEVPAMWQRFVPLNAERVAVLKSAGAHGLAPGLGNITEKQQPLLGAGCKKS